MARPDHPQREDALVQLFNEDQEPHDSAALRRQSSEDLRKAGILPNVPGLFDETASKPDAILLSHAQEDHTGLLRHSPVEIPIYASVGTSKMMLAGSKFAGQPALPQERHREIHAGRPVQIGDFCVTAFSVDHSIYGAQAFLIEAEDKTVLYSGDLRMHGRKPGMHKSLIKAVKDRTIDVLLMEGTHISHPDHRGPNEYDLEDEIVGHIQSAPGLVLASFSPQHVDRLVGFFRATKKTDRIFNADAYTAFVMHLIASETSIPRPESTEQVKVFFPKFFEETYEKQRLEKFFTLMSPARIGMEEIRSNPSRYVMLFRPSMLESDFGGILPDGSRCLYSRRTVYRLLQTLSMAGVPWFFDKSCRAYRVRPGFKFPVIEPTAKTDAPLAVTSSELEPLVEKLISDGETFAATLQQFLDTLRQSRCEP